MAKGEKRMCSTCNSFVEVMELIPSEVGWYIQKLSCGHTGRIRIMDPIEERIEITDELKGTTTKFQPYGQIHRTGPKDTRNIPCKDWVELNIGLHPVTLVIIIVTCVSVQTIDQHSIL